VPAVSGDRLIGSGRTALVTGASRGIGLALAELLGELGYSLTLVARNQERLAGAELRLKERGVDVQAVAVDLQTEEGVVRAVQAHREKHGRLDVLVNNAGFGISSPIEEYSAVWIDRLLAVNLRSVILLYREAVDLLGTAGLEHGNALVVNMSSVAGKAGHELISVYSAAKHGVVGFTQAMNQELSARGIKSCAICPGYVDTDLADYFKGEIPAEEMIRTSDIAEMVRGLLFLSSSCVVSEIVMTRPGDAVVA
jgi:NAD(P)-dependent dehydrogenase (short-subunit alcohol dehydrogenase family)